MANGLDHAMTFPQTAIGKGTVGEPAEAPAGKEGVTVRVAIFFDGTKSNRTNTTKRLNDPTGYFLKLKGAGSSYGNSYSNPAIHELMNKRKDPAKHEVSTYIEGIGTEDFSDEDQESGNVSDKKNGQDTLRGNGFGAGSAGIREKVQKGINKLNKKIKESYTFKEQYIEKIVVDAFGFSRGAAAARHFIYRRAFLYGPWPDQKRPKVVINFVGLYDTVSSFAPGIANKWGLLKNLRNALNTDRLFCDDVKELGLDMGALPNQVVHLTAGDEHRQNFSLTTINTTLAAGKGVEVRLPGVHSDIGGSYVERDPANPTHDPAQPIRDLNQEARRVASSAERQRLIEEGWYTAGQFEDRNPALRGGVDLNGFPEPSVPRLTGVRYLSNEYQYVTLRLMHRFALGQLGGAHKKMDLADFSEDRYVAYQVPAPLLSLADHFGTEAQTRGRRPVASNDDKYPNGTPPEALECRSEAERNWLRNRYLHRSAKLKGDFEPLGMEKRKDELRLVIPDDDLAYRPPSLRPKSAPTAEAVTG